MEYKYLKEICNISTGYKDANEGSEHGKYFFFTCAAKPLRSNTYTFSGESIILPGNGANVGLVLYYNGKFEAYQRTYVLNEFVNAFPRFVYYFFLKDWKKHNNFIQYGSATNYIRMENFLSFKVPLPNLTIQKQIAETLDKADELRQKRKKAIELLDEYLRSVFYDIFGNPVKNEKGWEKITIGEIVSELKYGTNEKSSINDIKSSTPVIRIPNVLYGTVSFDNLKYSVISKKEKEELFLKNGDLLFVRSNGNPNYIGRCAVYKSDFECVFASYLIRARVSETSDILPEYLQFYLSLPDGRRKMLKQAKTTAGNYNISTSRIRSIDLLKPEFTLQKKFIKILDQVEKTKAKMLESLKEMDNLFNSLMQKAFKV